MMLMQQQPRCDQKAKQSNAKLICACYVNLNSDGHNYRVL